MLVTTLGALYGITVGTYDLTVVKYLEVTTKGTVEGNLDGLLLGD